MALQIKLVQGWVFLDGDLPAPTLKILSLRPISIFARPAGGREREPSFQFVNSEANEMWKWLKRWIRRPAPTVTQPLGIIFVDRKELRKKLERAIDSPAHSPKRLFYLYGENGRGKSHVLVLVEDLSRQRDVTHAWVTITPNDTELAVLRQLAGQLKLLELESFRSNLDRYDAIQLEIVKESRQAEASRAAADADAAADAVGTVAEIGVQFTPFALVGPAVGKASKYLTNRVVAARTFSKGREAEAAENALALRPGPTLLKEFCRGLEKLKRDGRAVILLFDLQGLGVPPSWMREWTRQLPPIVLAIVAGRDELDWTNHGAFVAIEELGKMRDDDIRELVVETMRDIEPNEADLNTLVGVAGGNPFLATVLAKHWNSHGHLPFGESLPEEKNAVYLKLLEKTDGSVREPLQAVATVRLFNKDTLRSLRGLPDIDKEFDELRRSPFVVELDNGWAVRGFIRDVFNESLRKMDRSRFEKLHSTAHDFYVDFIAKHPDDLDERQRMECERIYHQYQLSRAKGEQAFREAFENAYYLCEQFDFCRGLVHDFNSYADDNGWGKYYSALIRHRLDEDVEGACEILENVLLRGPDRKLKANVCEYLATLSWLYRGGEVDNLKRAEVLYKQCLEIHSERADKHGQIQALVGLGMLHQRESGHSHSEFATALALCEELGESCRQLRYWLEKELADAYRLQGLFEKSRTHIESSIDGHNRLGRHLDKGHAIRTKGMLLVFQGRLREAESEFTLARSVFNEGRVFQHWEKGWIHIGLGDVALGRGDYDAASREYEQALRALTDNEFGRAVVNGQLAEVACAQGRWEQAIELAKESIAQREHDKDRFGIGWSLHTKGQALAATHAYADALECFEEGFRQMYDYGSIFGQSKLCLGIARACYLQGEYPRFSEVIGKIEEWAQEYQYHDHLAEARWLSAFLELEKVLKSDGGDPTNTLDADVVGRVATLLADALVFAMQFNIYLVDAFVDRTRSELNKWMLSNGLLQEDKSKVMQRVRDEMKSRWRIDASLKKVELDQRDYERMGETPSLTVDEQLEEAIAELQADMRLQSENRK